jgi:hypothetical protein
MGRGPAHFADHCASCHANDGGGATELGRNMFPRAPDMRLPDTQNLTDGEIYWVIANGIRLTGMPAWGPGGPDDADTWKLVHFIRRLKDLTAADPKAMKALNPRSLGGILRAERADQQFPRPAKRPREAASPEAHHHVRMDHMKHSLARSRAALVLALAFCVPAFAHGTNVHVRASGRR